jgi:subtilisin family serine protease
MWPGLAVGVIWLVLSPRGVDAKQAQVSDLSGERRAVALHYPELPKDVQDRILGIKVQPSAPRPENQAAKDWGFVDIGLFDIFTANARPLVSNKVEACQPEVVVAVVDTGIDYTHPQLRDNLWINRGETGSWEPPAGASGALASCHDKSCNGIDDDGNGFVDDVVGWDFVHEVPLPYDTHGHGTHIAGIISNSSGASQDLSGVCPRVAIMPLKYYDNSGAGYNNLANTVRAIRYAVKEGANIINYSGGGADPADSERAAIDDARRHGILFVAAAGNDGHNNEQTKYFPASYPLDNIIGVASVNKLNQLLPSSNYGKIVQMAAPGLMVLSTLPEGRFGTMSGTSQATAFVTGAAAMLASQSTTAGGYDYHRLKKWLLEGAKPMPVSERKPLAAGLLNLPGALRAENKDQAPTRVSAPEIAVRGRRAQSSSLHP